MFYRSKAPCGHLGADLTQCWHQLLAHHPQIGQRGQREHLTAVWRHDLLDEAAEFDLLRAFG